MYNPIVFFFLSPFSLIKNSKSYRTASLLVVPATFVTVAVLLAKGLNANQRGLEILLDVQWDTLWKLDVSVVYSFFIIDFFFFFNSFFILFLQIWYHAVVQFFFTTHLGFGNITTCAGRLYSKSNPFW